MASLVNTYSDMSASNRRLLIVGALLIVALTAGALWWALSSHQALLFGDLKESDAAEVSAALDEWKIPHGYSEDGSGILVEQSQVHPLRMRLVSAGIPKGGHVGFELFDKSELGVTEFAQRISYQRALQGELERTIAAIPGVQNVRVHLSIRRPGVFLAESAESKASVAVTLTPGASLGLRQVNGIRNLVASAVDGLRAESVVVVGPTGLQLGGAATDGESDEVQGGMANTMATQYESEIRKLLANTPGGENAAVSVNVQLNFDKIRKTSERLLEQPGREGGAVVRRSTSSDKSPEGGTGSTVNEQFEYAHGTEKEEVTKAVGRIEKISVAVALARPLGEVQQQHLQHLVAAAVGADLARGDVIEIGVTPRTTVASAADSNTGRQAKNPVTSISAESGGMVSPVWLFAVGILGLAIGVLVGSSLSRRKARYLTRRQSEVAASQIRAWLGAPVK